MQVSEFTKDKPGQLTQGVGGYTAFVPAALPPALTWTTALVRDLSAATGALGQLDGITKALPNPRLLMRTFITREAVLSSRIEGTHASISDMFLFDISPTVEDTVPDVREVSNYIRALEFGLERLKKIPLCLNMILDMHRILLEKVRGDSRHPGEFRRVANWIGPRRCTQENARYVPPPPETLPALLDAFEKYLHASSDLPLLVRLALTHYQFEALHPFEDGNGRLGRLLISLQLVSHGVLSQPSLYLSAYFERHRQQYYDLLLDVSRRGAWTDWLSFFLAGITQESMDAVERATRLVTLRDQFHAKCHNARTSALLLKLVDQLFRWPAVNMPRVRKLLNVQPQSAQHNTDYLVKVGILRENTGQQRNRVWVAPAIIRTLEDAPSLDHANP